MGGVRENCRWIPGGRIASRDTGINVDPHDHPDLLATLANLARYVDYVETVLTPIASKWIDEHRDEVIAGMSDAEKNDMGSAMAKAISIVQSSDWYKTQVERGKNFDYQEALKEGRANPTWIQKSEAFKDFLQKGEA